MGKIITLLSLFVCSSVASITDCGAGKSVFQIQSQGFAPEPPVANEKYDYWFAYTVPEGITVDAGTVKYSLTLNGIPFPPTVDDLCTQTACPKVPGFYNESSSDVWPGGVSGKIVTKLEWFDTNGAQLLCSQTTEKV